MNGDYKYLEMTKDNIGKMIYDICGKKVTALPVDGWHQKNNTVAGVVITRYQANVYTIFLNGEIDVDGAWKKYIGSKEYDAILFYDPIKIIEHSAALWHESGHIMTYKETGEDLRLLNETCAHLWAMKQSATNGYWNVFGELLIMLIKWALEPDDSIYHMVVKDLTTDSLLLEFIKSILEKKAQEEKE